MGGNLKLRHSNDENGPIGRFEAVVPENSKFPSYIEIKKAVLKVIPRKVSGAIFVSPVVLKEIPDYTNIQYNKSSFRKFIWYKTKNDKSQKVALIGLVMAAIGTSIDTSFVIGKLGWVLKELNYNQTKVLLGLSWALKIVGLLLAFYKSLIDGK